MLKQLPERFSPNAIKSFQQCAKQYELKYVQRLAWPQSTTHFEFGLQLHQLMDYQAKGFDVVTFLASLNDARLKQAFETLHASRWGSAEIIASEWPFRIPFERKNGQRYWLEGRIDRIAVDSDRQQYVVLDWKTGTSAPTFPETDWQTRLYLYVMSQLGDTLTAGPFNVKDWAMVYVELKQVGESFTIQERRVQLTESFLRQTHEDLDHLLDRLQAANAFPLPPACPDKYCPYAAICGIRETPPNEASLAT